MNDPSAGSPTEGSLSNRKVYDETLVRQVQSPPCVAGGEFRRCVVASEAAVDESRLCRLPEDGWVGGPVSGRLVREPNLSVRVPSRFARSGGRGST